MTIARADARPSGRATLDRAVREKDFRQQVLDYARLRRWKCYWTWASIHSPPGYPDLTCVRGDRVLFAELKSERGHTTEAQRRWLWALAEAGMEVHIWRPSTWSLVEEVLR